MELVPPVDWADVATKRDLDMLGLELRSEMNGLRVEMHRGFESVQRDLRLQLYWLIGIVLSAIGGVATVSGI